MPLLNDPFWWDEELIIRNEFYDSVKDFFTYGRYGRSFFNGHIPLPNVYYYFLHKAFPDNFIFLARLSTQLINFSFIYFGYKLLASIGNKNIAFAMVLTLMVTPFYLAHSHMIYMHLSMVGFGLGALYFHEKKKNKLYLLMAVLSICFRESGVMFSIAVFSLDFIRDAIKKTFNLEKAFFNLSPILAYVFFIIFEKVKTDYFFNHPVMYNDDQTFLRCLKDLDCVIQQVENSLGVITYHQINLVFLISIIAILVFLFIANSKRNNKTYITDFSKTFFISFACYYLFYIFYADFSDRQAGPSLLAVFWLFCLLLNKIRYRYFITALCVFVLILNYSQNYFSKSPDTTLYYRKYVKTLKSLVNYQQSISKERAIYSSWPIGHYLRTPIHGYTSDFYRVYNLEDFQPDGNVHFAFIRIKKQGPTEFLKILSLHQWKKLKSFDANNFDDEFVIFVSPSLFNKLELSKKI